MPHPAPDALSRSVGGRPEFDQDEQRSIVTRATSVGSLPSTDGARRGMLSEERRIPMGVERHLVVNREVAPRLLVETTVTTAR